MEKETPKDQAVRKFIADNLSSKEEGKVIVIREGDAPKPLDVIKPNKVHLKGTISAPSEFYNKRKKLHDPDKCHVLFDRNKGTITLVTDENFENDNHKITGEIQDNPDLKPFQINTNHLFGVKELMGILKFNRIHFVDKEANAKIVLSLQNFKAKIEKTLADTSDLRGTDEKSKLTKLETELEESFKLSMPMHKGGKSVVFVVDICLSASSSDVQVWLESKELKELQDGSRNAILDDELKNFTSIVCIEQ
jgi:hypothetical protein